MDNQTALNETNQTVETVFQIKDITDVQFLFSEAQRITSELLISWGFVPENIYFRILIILFGVIGLYQLFVTFSSKTGGIFRYVLMVVLLLVVIIALGII